MFENKISKFLSDFSIFTDYLSNNEVTVSKTKQYISPKFLYELNEFMSIEENDVTLKSNQLFYPLIHLFYNLSLSGKLAVITSAKGGKLVLKSTDRLKKYNELNNTEKYIFLLETLWVDCDFENMKFQTYDDINEYVVDEVLRDLYSVRANETILIQGNIRMYSTILLYFSYFRLMDIEENQEIKSKIDVKRSFIPGKITINELGSEIIKILCDKRHLEEWNLQHCKSQGNFNVEFSEPFCEVFKRLFKKGELKNTLPREKHNTNEGIYTLKVTLSRGVWSKLKLSSQHTMEDLHNCIQEAFALDNDHLYSFFMDGKAWSNNRISSPYENEEPSSNKVKVGELQLYKKQKFLYLFDYGDEWRFNIEVVDIEDTDTKLLRPIIDESKGQAPQQYGGWGRW